MEGSKTLTRKQKKEELRRHQSTRQLMGIEQLTGHGAKTAAGELLFYLVRPDNLSVLSADGILGRVTALTNLLRTEKEVRLLALDSRESFQSNKLHYQDRMAVEELPALRELLRQDMAHLDEIQSSTASAREFAFVFPLEKQDAANTSRPKDLEKSLHGYGFHVRLAEPQDIMRLLAVYYQQDVTTEHFDHYDGESVVNGNG